MKRWLCDSRVVEDIHGPKVCTFTLLFVLSTAGFQVLLFFLFFPIFSKLPIYSYILSKSPLFSFILEKCLKSNLGKGVL